MKARILITLVLMGLLLTIGGSAPVLATSPRGIVGRIGFHGPWPGGMDIFIDFDVREVNPDKHNAMGSCMWMIWHEE
jgi:hypothetical protein